MTRRTSVLSLALTLAALAGSLAVGIDRPSAGVAIGPGGHIIQSPPGTDLTTRPRMSFGSGVTCTDDAGNNRTNCIGGGVPAANYYVAGHTYPVELRGGASLTSSNCMRGNCAWFDDGTADYGAILGSKGTNLLSTSAWTVSFWYYVDAVGVVHNLVEQFDNVGTVGNMFIRINTSNQLVGRVASGTTYEACTGTTALSINTLYLLSVTFNSNGAGNGTLICYVNTTAENTNSAVTINPTASTQLIRLGAAGALGAPATFAQGKMDELMIYNTSLTGTDITNIHGAGTACSVQTASLVYCNPFSESSGTLAQPTTYPTTGLGSDSYDGLSTGAALRTCQAAVDKISAFYGGSTVIHLASGVLPETCAIKGKHRNGPYYIKILGYTNSTPNSFTDSAVLSGTLSANGTNNHPADAGSTMTDVTLSQFGTAGLQDNRFVRLTATADWYPIWTNSSSSVIKIASPWSTNPLSGAAYEIFDYEDMATLHGGEIRNQGLQIIDSDGVQVHGVRFRMNIGQGLFIRNSSLGTTDMNSWWPQTFSYDIVRNSFDGNSTLAATQGAGAWLSRTAFGGIIRNIFRNNRDLGLVVALNSSGSAVDDNLLRANTNDAGYLQAYHGTVFRLRGNTALGNTSFYGFDFESGSVVYDFGLNRGEANGGGTVVATTSSLTYADNNYMVSNTDAGFSGYTVYGQGTINAAVSGQRLFANSNTGPGLLCSGTGSVFDPTDTNYWSFSGNTGGAYTLINGCAPFSASVESQIEIAIVSGNNNDLGTGVANTLVESGDPGGAFTITGMTNGWPGRRITLIYTGVATARTMTIANQSASSAVGNRISTNTGSNVGPSTAAGGAIATFEYVGAVGSGSWRQIGWDP